MKGEVNLSMVVASLLVSMSLVSGFLFFYNPFLEKYGVTSTINPSLTQSYDNTTKIIENVSSSFTQRNPSDVLGQVFDLTTIFALIFKDVVLTIPNTVGSLVTNLNTEIPSTFQIPLWVITLIVALTASYVIFRVASIIFKRTDT